MVEIKHKTRGNSSVQGKPKVYFSCHPEDFGKYFQSVCDEILSINNCAVYYYLPEDIPETEERLQQLEDMQLIVVPVTSNFLFKKNDARETDFLYAVQKHIPVLPLLMEKNLVESFNSICGDKQFLNKFDTDPTAITYEEKFEKFINSVLVDDETAKEIRDAFWAYIFLSYRKKDRKYARELMDLIHSNEKYKDVAIWYDEYLTPGEDFNEEISDALIKSAVFMLLVTPNLLEVPNYVMKDEHPAALEFSKNIVPAEAIETDRDELEAKFTEIPRCIKATDEEEVFAQLEKTVGKKGVISDPRHQYLMGMAYLSGIDVEVSYPRALELLVCSADAGCADAIKKLAYMYRNGDGVKKDYTQAALWKSKLVDVYEKEYEELNTEESKTQLFKEKLALAEWLKEINRYSDAKNIIVELENMSINDRHLKTDLLSLSGILYYSQNEYEIAREKFSEIEKLVDTKDVNSAYSYITACNNLAALASKMQKFDEAIQQMEETISFLEKLLEENSLDYPFFLLELYNNLGYMLFQVKKFEEALIRYEKAEEIAKSINEEYPGDADDDMARLYNNMALLYKQLHKFDLSEEKYLQAVEIRMKQYNDAPEAFGAKLANVYSNLSVLYEENHMDGDAERVQIDAINIIEKLYKQNPDFFAYDMSNRYYNIAYLYRKQEKYEQSTEKFEKAIDILEAADKKCPDVYQPDLALYYHNFGRMYYETKNYDDSEKYYKLGLDIRKRIAEDNPDAYADELSASYSAMGLLYTSKEEYAEAEDMFKEAERVSLEILEHRPDVYKNEIASNYSNFSSMYIKQKNYVQGVFYLEEAIKIRTRLNKDHKNAFAYELMTDYATLAYICKESNDYIKAEDKFCKAMKLGEWMYDKGIEVGEDLMIIYSGLIEVYQKLHKSKDERYIYAKGCKLQKKLKHNKY